MATVDKDFRVKQGLNVALGGTFGGTVTVATPTSGSHATTKTYVDSIELTERIYVYYSSTWIAIATLADAEVLQEHIHDTAIGGTGQIATTFVDAGYYYEAGSLISAGFYNTDSFDATYDGGTATEVYN